MQEQLVAVYGTLREGCSNNRLMKQKGIEFLGGDNTKPEFKMTSAGGFPIVTTEGDKPIVIEVYKVTDQLSLQSIFRLEGYTGRRNDPNNWYNTVDVETKFGKAMMFVMPPTKYPNMKEIPSGDWTNQ